MTETSTHQSSDDDDDGFLLVGGPDGGYPPGSRYDGFNNLEEVHAFSDDERSNKE